MSNNYFYPDDARHYLRCGRNELRRICKENLIPYLEEGGIRYYEYGPEIVALKRERRARRTPDQLKTRTGRRLVLRISFVVPDGRRLKWGSMHV